MVLKIKEIVFFGRSVTALTNTQFTSLKISELMH